MTDDEQARREFRDKIRTVGVIGKRSGNQVSEGRDKSGNLFKATTDELGNTVTERTGDRQDVHIAAPQIIVDMQAQEVR